MVMMDVPKSEMLNLNQFQKPLYNCVCNNLELF